MNCPHCHQPLPDAGASTCPFCGMPVNSAAEDPYDGPTIIPVLQSRDQSQDDNEQTQIAWRPALGNEADQPGGDQPPAPSTEAAEPIDSADTVAYTPPTDQPQAPISAETVAEAPVDMPTELAAMPPEPVETPAESPTYMPTEVAPMSLDMAETAPAMSPVSEETPTEPVAAPAETAGETPVDMPTELAPEPPAYTPPAYTPPEPPTYTPPTYTPPTYTPPAYIPPAPPAYTPPTYTPPAPAAYSPPLPATEQPPEMSPAADQLAETVVYAPNALPLQQPPAYAPPAAQMEPPRYNPPAYAPPAYTPPAPEQPPAYTPSTPAYTPPMSQPPKTAQTYGPPQQAAYRATPQPWSGQEVQPRKKGRAGGIIGCLAVLVLIAALAGGGIFYVRSQPNGVVLGGVTIGGASTGPGVIYQDALDGSTKSRWTNDSNCFFGSGGYHINAGYICYAPADKVGDAVTAVTVKQISGPITYGYGVVIRRVSKGNYYEFEIDANGKWRFSKVVGGNVTDIVSFTSNDAITKGLNQVNTISVQAKGSHFVFSINGKEIGSADDSTFASGDTGLIGYNGIEVVFTNLSIANAKS